MMQEWKAVVKGEYITIKVMMTWEREKSNEIWKLLYIISYVFS